MQSDEDDCANPIKHAGAGDGRISDMRTATDTFARFVDVLAETLASLAGRYDDLLDGRFDAILDEWRGRAPGGCGARVSWTTPSGTQNGVTAGIDDRGALLVDIGGRLERIVAGELTWL